MRYLRLIVLATAVPLVGMAGSALAASDNGKCEVTVDRSRSAGTYSVSKQVADNGDCVCYLYTGPAAEQSSTLENRIAQLQRDRTCDDAPVVAMAGGAAAAGAAAGGGAVAAGIGIGTIAPLGIAAAAGIAIAANGNDSPGG